VYRLGKPRVCIDYGRSRVNAVSEAFGLREASFVINQPPVHWPSLAELVLVPACPIHYFYFGAYPLGHPLGPDPKPHPADWWYPSALKAEQCLREN
jgi:hypothetical protein